MIKINESEIPDKQTGKEIAKALELGVSKDVASISTKTLDSYIASTADADFINELRTILKKLLSNIKGQ